MCPKSTSVTLARRYGIRAVATDSLQVSTPAGHRRISELDLSDDWEHPGAAECVRERTVISRLARKLEIRGRVGATAILESHGGIAVKISNGLRAGVLGLSACRPNRTQTSRFWRRCSRSRRDSENRMGMTDGPTS